MIKFGKFSFILIFVKVPPLQVPQTKELLVLKEAIFKTFFNITESVVIKHVSVVQIRIRTFK
jgi:hypothetical protein